MAHVLIVDDDPAVGLTLSRMLEADGHQVIREETATGGLERAGRDRPQALILDMRMPGLGGLEFLRALRQTPGGASVPVAVLTGDYFLKDEALAELGTLGAVVRYKPLWLDDLTALMRELLSGSQDSDH
jgi:CheY-like chemotaxis protein